MYMYPPVHVFVTVLIILIPIELKLSIKLNVEKTLFFLCNCSVVYRFFLFEQYPDSMILLIFQTIYMQSKSN